MTLPWSHLTAAILTAESRKLRIRISFSAILFIPHFMKIGLQVQKVGTHRHKRIKNVMSLLYCKEM